MHRSQIFIMSFLWIGSLFGCATNPEKAVSGARPCLTEPERQQARSNELKEIVKADQDERKEFMRFSSLQLFEMSKHDLSRRKRVAEIFAEGCFKIASDYSEAALVFQHGDNPDHFSQSFIWSKRAVELGDPSQKR